MSIRCKQDEITLIQEKITKTDKMISQLLGERIALLRELNLVQSATGNLPPETLAVIFEHYFSLNPPPNHFYSPPVPWEAHGYLGQLILGHVSSYWRQVLWSTPRFWTSMRIGISENNADSILGIFELHLENVGKLHFNIDIVFPPCVHGNSDIGNPIKAALTKYSNKVRRLQLSYLPIGWVDTIRKFSSLEWISVSRVSNFRCHGLQLNLSELRQLRYVAFDGVHGNIQLPWEEVRTLRLKALPINHSAELLRRCRNLVEFSSGESDIVSHSTTDPISRSVVPATPVTFPKMRNFKWTYHGSQWDRAVFQYFRFPALEELSLDFSLVGVQEDDEDATRALFNNLKDTLRVLKVAGFCNWTVPFAKHIFSRSLYAQDVRLFFTDENSIYSVLCALCPGWDGEDTTLLPFLDRLYISCQLFGRFGHNGNWEAFTQDYKVPSRISSRILDICKARSPSPGFELTFDFGTQELTWAPRVFEELSAVVRDGFDLYIYHSNDKVVTWLS